MFTEFNDDYIESGMMDTLLDQMEIDEDELIDAITDDELEELMKDSGMTSDEIDDWYHNLMKIS